MFQPGARCTKGNLQKLLVPRSRTYIWIPPVSSRSGPDFGTSCLKMPWPPLPSTPSEASVKLMQLRPFHNIYKVKTLSLLFKSYTVLYSRKLCLKIFHRAIMVSTNREEAIARNFRELLPLGAILIYENTRVYM